MKTGSSIFRWAATGSAFAALILLSACSTVPLTGRSQLLLVSPSQEIQLGISEFDKIKKQTPLSKDADWNQKLQRAGLRISAVAPLPGAQWEFVLLDDPKTINAFCLPGGKVAVYTGILGIAKDEGGLATIIGHEVSHAVAHHGAERMSEAMLIQAGGSILSVATQGKSSQTQQLFQKAYGIGAQIGVALPHSRSQETEADRMGLIYMARAGYDPRDAVFMWQRFSAYNKSHGNTPIPWLSTHPVDDKRILQLQQQMPQALLEYNQATGAR